jgi:uncharacterized SAM-binding protein YcdF (DUF218 family)
VFIVLSKVFDLAIAPVTWVLVLLLLAFLLRGRARGSLACGALAFAVLLVFSLGPVTERLTRAAEGDAVATFRPEATYDAAVVLGGMVDAPASRASGEVELTEAADRVTRALELWRSGRVKALVISGGNVWPRPGEPAEAERLAAKLAAWGVPPEALVVEGKSRNTRENALETARVVAARGYTSLVLVTSALHMPRALGCFRAVGITPDALPVDRRASDGAGDSWQPRVAELSKATDVLRELAGRLVYRVAGYTR